MSHLEKQPRFEIRSTIEQKPFESPGVQFFFTKWCEINDSIEPQIVSRDDWERQAINGILEKRSDGKQNLFIPADLQLWEMVGVMETVDRDTFAAKLERQVEAKDKLLELGGTFQNAGAYIAQRLESVGQGKDIARALAEEFYDYGQLLSGGEKPGEPSSIEDIANKNLTAGEIEAVDRFLAGDNLYESRRLRAGKTAAIDPDKKIEFYETERRKTLAQFFRVSEKAFKLQERAGGGELREGKAHLKPWQSHAPLHSVFLAKVERALAQKIETPKRELNAAIFRRGLENLVNEMRETESTKRTREALEPGWKKAFYSFFKKLGIDLRFEQKKITDILHIKRLKAELKAIRRSGDMVKISAKERDIANKIQKAVSGFPYQYVANNPSEMVANKYINCVGASTLGGALMREVELNYLVGDVPEHSILFLVTSDGRVEWRDMLDIPSSSSENLTDQEIRGRKSDGSPLVVEDIAAFSKKPSPEGLMFDIEGKKYRDKLNWTKEGPRQYIAVFGPEYGQQMQILGNTGTGLSRLDCHKEALEVYRQAAALSPKYAVLYDGMGSSLRALGRLQEAIEAYRQAVKIDPKYANAYYNLGNVFCDLGRNEEAIETYHKFIDLADRPRDDFWIKAAEQVIAKLKK